jgi:8-amino-7-oxononanoate synthase
LSKGSGLTGPAREHLLSRVTSMRTAERSETIEPFALDLMASRFTDFSTLPGYEELRLQRSIGDKLGLENPYFRMHDARITARTHVDGRELLNFSSYDYLGLNGHPDVVTAAKDAIDRYGISASASRHVAGERPVHRSLERALAAHYGWDDALVFVSGYATASEPISFGAKMPAAQPAPACVALPPATGQGKVSPKSNAVGLENSCPGGAFNWAP